MTKTPQTDLKRQVKSWEAQQKPTWQKLLTNASSFRIFQNKKKHEAPLEAQFYLGLRHTQWCDVTKVVYIVFVGYIIVYKVIVVSWQGFEARVVTRFTQVEGHKTLESLVKVKNWYYN